MFSPTVRTHIRNLIIIGVTAALVNSVAYLVSGIPPKYNLNSDATVHEVQWQEFSQSYAGNFNNDIMFQNFQEVPSGVLIADKALVRTAEFLRIDLLDWSVIISILTLALFLSGFYFLVFYTTKKSLISLLLTLVSIVPVISLGLSTWGSSISGFVPKEISVGVSLWLTILYLKGVSENSRSKIATFFLLLGLFANFYLTLFFHYAVVMLTVEVIRCRSIRKEHVAYGLLFLAAAPLALFDIFVRAGHFAPPNLSIIIDHYGNTLRSPAYLLLHYLRKQIIYAVLVGVMWYLYRRVFKREYPILMQVWYAIWWSTLLWSLVGVGIEVFAPLYMKYLISRISVWFYPASMIIIAYTAYELWFTKFRRSFQTLAAFSLLLVLVLLSQTSLLNVYNGIREQNSDAADYKQYLSVVTKLHDIVPPNALVLANPDGAANTIRTYGGVGTYVAAKDGIVMLFDGGAAELWFARYKEAERLFAEKDFLSIMAYARERNLRYYFFDMRDIGKDRQALERRIIIRSGPYGLADLSPAAL